MKCDHMGERLVDSWNDQLDDAERDELDRHLGECDDCRGESERLEALWHQLGALEKTEEVPSERLRSRFYRFLAEEERRRRGGFVERLGRWLEAVWPIRPQLQAAMVAAALVLGVLIGVGATGSGSPSEIELLRAELASVSETVSLSLLTHRSASERIRGVGLTARADGDERIVISLIGLIESDPNINVRLAAIEALAGRIRQPGVKPRLLETLPLQNSPLLQMTLLDVLLPDDGELVLEAAEPLLAEEGLDEAVRERLLAAKGDSA